MATVKEAFTAKHRGTTGDDIEDVDFGSGESVNILKEWKRHYLVQRDDGKVFNIEKDKIDP